MTDLDTVVVLTRQAKLLDPKEVKARVHLTEGEWEDRMTRYLDNPANHIPNVGIVRDCARAILTKKHAPHLAKATVAKHTQLLKRWEK